MTGNSDIDADFRLCTGLSEESIQWYDCFDDPFRIHGTCAPQCAPPFCRMAPASLERMSSDVRSLAHNTAGIRLRMKTDSGFIALKARLSSSEDMSHMPRTGSSGFDLYCGGRRNPVFLKNFAPGAASDAVVGEMLFSGQGLKDITLCFPLYNGVKAIEIGLQRGAAVESATPYGHSTPIVFYGSSITQGGCASRPGNSYELILSRLLDADIVNLGFSGSARGEQDMADYIASLEMQIFVMDYDHNAPTVQHLQDTHYQFYDTIRSRQPGLPIVMMSRPDIDICSPEHIERRNVIFGTYRRALDAKDNHAYYVDGERLFGAWMRDSCTVDTCHPNDLGFMRMAETICPLLEKLLKEG